MGCEVTLDDDGLHGRRHRPGSQGIDVDLHDHGELTPAVAALCALADGPATCAASRTSAATRPTGSPRWPPSSAGSGADVTEHADGLSFRPAPLHGGVFHTYADHRMAHAGVIVGAAVDGVLVEDVATTGKTFPDFAGFWSGLF